MVVFIGGDALGDALVRPGRVAVHLVFTQDGTQMAFPEDQHAIQELTAQGTDEALADRVHPRSPDGLVTPGSGIIPEPTSLPASLAARPARAGGSSDRRQPPDVYSAGKPNPGN